MSISALEDVSAPLRRCSLCGEHKPWTEAHFTKRTKPHKDGSRRPNGWETRCRPCNTQRVKDFDAAKRARKKAGIAETPAVVKALEKAPLPVKPSKPSFRSVLQAKAEAKWPQIANHMVDAAAKGDKNMIKLVSAYVLGVPREASEDDGPTEFWHALLAGARQLHAGGDAPLGAADPDLEPDPGPD